MPLFRDGADTSRGRGEISQVASRTASSEACAKFDAGVPAAQCKQCSLWSRNNGILFSKSHWRIPAVRCTVIKVDGRFLDILSWGDLSAGWGLTAKSALGERERRVSEALVLHQAKLASSGARSTRRGRREGTVLAQGGKRATWIFPSPRTSAVAVGDGREGADALSEFA